MPSQEPVHARVECEACAMSAYCLPEVGRPRRNPATDGTRRLSHGQTLYAAGEPCRSFYALRSGCLEVLVPDGAGSLHIARFLLPGDLAGLDAHVYGRHRWTARSVGASEVCEVRAWHLHTVAHIRPALAAHLQDSLASELDHALGHAAALARLTAPQRVAGFLLELSRRAAARGLAGALVSLPMGRREIGEHLGLTMETASRILGSFRTRGWIELPRHAVRILDEGALRAAAGETPDP